MVEEIIQPQGTPLCGYARGTFTDEHRGDKSVGFRFATAETAVFYNKELVTPRDALWSVYREMYDGTNVMEEQHNTELLRGHIIGSHCA